MKWFRISWNDQSDKSLRHSRFLDDFPTRSSTPSRWCFHHIYPTTSRRLSIATSTLLILQLYNHKVRSIFAIHCSTQFKFPSNSRVYAAAFTRTETFERAELKSKDFSAVLIHFREQLRPSTVRFPRNISATCPLDCWTSRESSMFSILTVKFGFGFLFWFGIDIFLFQAEENFLRIYFFRFGLSIVCLGGGLVVTFSW